MKALSTSDKTGTPEILSQSTGYVNALNSTAEFRFNIFCNSE